MTKYFHKTIRYSAILAISALVLVRLVYPGLFTPQKVMAAINSWTWDTLADFTDNDGSTGVVKNSNVNLSSGNPKISDSSRVTENSASQFGAGIKSNTTIKGDSVILLKPSGATATNNDECASGLVVGGYCQETVVIGSQVWMKNNLNIGTMINGSSVGSDDGIVEKYCYNNDPSYCAAYGALYTMNEATDYAPITGGQGVCPTGFHIPSVADWSELIASGISQSNLMDGGSSGFNLLIPGILVVTSGFSYVDSQSFYLTSEVVAGFNDRVLKTLRLNYSSMYIFNINGYNLWNTYGLPIRCIKNV